MEKLSYSFLIDNKISVTSQLKNYGFDTNEQINLVYILMCFVLDKSLKDEESTLDNMSSYLDKIILNYFNKYINEEEVREITRFIIYRVLRNEGKPFIFNTLNYSNNESVTYEYHLLQQKPSKDNKNKSTFYLTQEGYRLLLSSLEIDEKMQIDINQMILELSLKRKNFSQGLTAIENLNNLIRSQISVINNFIYKTRENIFSINQEEFQNNFLKNIEVLKEQNDRFEELKNIVILEEERLMSNDKIIDENLESLRQLGRIKELLISISQKSGYLISKHFQFKDEYKKALEEASYYYSNKRINIKEDILKPIEENAMALENFYKLINPFFVPKIKKKFNINKILEEQKIYTSEDEEDEVEIEEIKEEQEIINKLRKRKEEYKGIISCILEFIVKQKNTTFKEIIDYYSSKNDEEFKKLVPTVRELSEIIIEFLRIGEIDIEQMISEYEESYINEEIELDLRQMLVDEINEKYKFAFLKKLIFLKSDEIDIVEVKERVDIDKNIENFEFATIETMRCPNFIMKVE
jgi:hypothetical protein